MNDIQDHFEKYRSIRLAKGIMPSTIKAERKYLTYFLNYIQEYFPYIKDSLEVEKSHVQAYSLYVNKREDIKPNYKRTLLMGILSYYKESTDLNWILNNPTEDLVFPKKHRVIPRYLTVEDMKRFIESPDISTIRGIRDRTVLELFYSCAFRVDELLSLKVDDFSEQYRRVTLRRKGAKETVLPVGKMAAHFTKFYCETILPILNGNGHLVVTLKGDGKPLTLFPLNHILKTYSQKAGLKQIVTPHTFRYSTATHLADNGADIRHIQEFLSHNDIDTTSRYIGTSLQKIKEVHSRTHPRGAEHV